jgi:hypothetical protein
MSARWRLTLFNTLALGILLLLLGLVLRWQVGGILEKKLDASLLALAETELASAVDSPAGGIHLHPVAPSESEFVFLRIEKMAWILDDTDRVLLASSARANVVLSPSTEFLRHAKRRVTFRTVRSASGESFRMVGLPITGRLDGRVIVLATSRRGIERFQGTLDRVLAAVFVIAPSSARSAESVWTS